MAEVVELQKRSVRDAERRMLQEAIEGDMLSLALQPIAKATKVPEVIGYEALLRSSHSVLNGPLPLLRAAERTGQLTEIARAVSECAANCLELIPSNRVLFVNLHPEELTDLDVARGSLSPLIPYADRVVLEITERVRLQTIGNWEEAVKELAATGFRLAVDDLGSGYNSLSILADLQPRFIKADMSIVRNLDREPRKQRLIELLARFAEATDALLIAEGVEEEAEFEALRTCAAHLVQGYWIGRPEMDIERLLSEAV
jgi:EAL domain-containing protein (putative c-di-GMP-specific phosphodiesterase class I)